MADAPVLPRQTPVNANALWPEVVTAFKSWYAEKYGYAWSVDTQLIFIAEAIEFANCYKTGGSPIPKWIESREPAPQAKE